MRTPESRSAITVRDAAPEEARAIASVRGASWRAAYEHIFGPERLAAISEDDDARRWEAWLRALPAHSGTLVGLSDTDVLGFASHGPCRDEPGIGELFTIYVRPEAWGGGVGQALMRETLARLRAHGFDEAVLWVLEDNPRTRRFYECAGWSLDGGIKEETWLDVDVREVRYRIDLR